VLDADAAQEQRPARLQAVGVVSDADAHASGPSESRVNLPARGL
jgi:hypothetical protein